MTEHRAASYRRWRLPAGRQARTTLFLAQKSLGFMKFGDPPLIGFQISKPMRFLASKYAPFVPRLKAPYETCGVFHLSVHLRVLAVRKFSQGRRGCSA